MLASEAPLAFGRGAGLAPWPHDDTHPARPPTTAEIRASARIAKLIARLPESGSVVIVHSPSVIDAWRRLIRDMRGDALAGATRVIAAPSLRDERAATSGLTLPVFRDPFVAAQREHRRALAQAWRL